MSCKFCKMLSKLNLGVGRLPTRYLREPTRKSNVQKYTPRRVIIVMNLRPLAKSNLIFYRVDGKKFNFELSVVEERSYDRICLEERERPNCGYSSFKISSKYRDLNSRVSSLKARALNAPRLYYSST